MENSLNKKLLLVMIQKAIDDEQSPAMRIKELTPGLVKAKSIIESYTATDTKKYEYQIDSGSAWLKVSNNENITMLIDCGFTVRRKK